MKYDLKRRLGELPFLRANLLGGMARMEDDTMNDHHRTVSIPTDMEELANDDTNQEIMLTLLGSDGDTLDRIEAAVLRIEHGGYGQCEECGEEIPKSRLDAIPYAAECLRCASEQEEVLTSIEYGRARRRVSLLQSTVAGFSGVVAETESGKRLAGGRTSRLALTMPRQLAGPRTAS
jgi:DnaK suppressor protein